ncbi:MAG: mobile mystery protein B [Pseudomonadota bacterium]
MIGAELPEGATPIDPDDAAGLRLPHITTRGELDRWESENILKALAWLERIRPKDIINAAFIRRLHQKMFGDVWKWAGRYRTSAKNIGVPWHQVPVDVDSLCRDVPVWIASSGESPDEMAVRLHHRLVWIHPFSNGNGRHARLMTDLFMENISKGLRFTWGGADLTRHDDFRKAYIDALREADEGDLKPLLKFARS